jgi:hypothetical protein
VTLFINLRATSNGGVVADSASAWEDGSLPVAPEEFARRVNGRDLFLATHGFNVDQQDGITSLSLWSQRCRLPDSYLFVGVLWPGDSRWLPVVDYVYEGDEAIASGKLLSSYLNANAAAAQSLSFFSHSLGARTVLQTIRGLNAKPRNLIMMAGAIEDNCLAREYADAASRVSKICIVASRSDEVLEWAFPAGNLIGEIIMHGHPYDRTALGRDGPARPLPDTLKVTAWQIPDGWKYGHGDYLPKDAAGPVFTPPLTGPGPNNPIPVDTGDPANANWKPGWSAGAATTQVQS